MKPVLFQGCRLDRAVESKAIEPIERTARALQAPDLSSMPSNGDKQ